MQKLIEHGQEKKQHVVLKKHVATIHCSNTLSLLQRKISNALLFHAYHELLQKEEHEITVKALCNIIGYVGNNSAIIKEAIRGLISIVLEWNILNDKTGQEEWNASSALASVRISGAICAYSYSAPLKKLIYMPSVYGKINMVIQAKFKSGYGLALYENCVRYSGLPYTAWFDLVTFRKLMGIPAEQYVDFRDLKRRVLDKAVEEINAYAELQVAPEVVRVGRKVDKIRFSLKEIQKQRTENISPSCMIETSQELGAKGKLLENDLIRELVEDWAINIKQVQRWLQQYGVIKLRQKIDYVKSTANYKLGAIGRVGAYLRCALEDDYQKQEIGTLTTGSKKRKTGWGLTHKADYEEYAYNQAILVFKALPDDQRNLIEKSLIKKFETEAGGNIFLDLYRNKGIESIKDVFFHFVKMGYPALLKGIPSLEDYIYKNSTT